VGYFVTACAFLFDQGIVTSLAGLIALALLSAALIILHSAHTRYLSRRNLRLTFSLLLQAVPLMLLLLFVFPRIGALWSVPLKSSSSVTGVSDSMSPGDFSQLTRSRALAFRISFDNDIVPTPAERYWRGLVLTQFDGRRWQRDQLASQVAKADARFIPSDAGPSYTYNVVLEPTNTSWIYAMPLAVVENKSAQRSANNEWWLPEPVSQRIQYRVRSTPRYRVDESQDQLNQALLLPRGLNPKTLVTATQWRNSAVSAEAYIERVLNYYHQTFVYTLSPPTLGLNTVDEFLFSTQRGFCEHFASSFVVLMRAAGIPARVVTGYQGGEWNPVDRYLIVRQLDAHAWAELWLPNRGWVRVDPTAAVAPNRIEQGLLESLTDTDQALVTRSALPSFAWINRLALQWDGLNYRWQRWALSYDQDMQSRWLEKILGQVTPTRLALLLLVPGVFMLVLLGALTLYGTRTRPTRKVKVYALLVNKLKRRGVNAIEGETISELCRRAAVHLPQHKVLIVQLNQQLNSAFYQRNGDIDIFSYHQLNKSIQLL
jgi:transglutaminase-like putative cysteine protease